MSFENEMGKAADLAARTVKGFIAGCIGGAVASWAMNKFQEVSSQPLAAREAAESGEPAQGGSQKEPSHEKQDGGDDATVKTAQVVSRQVFDHDLSDGEKQYAGPAVHYAYGTLVGGVYGGLSELVPALSMGMGVPYGAALFVLGDEVAVPALGLGGSLKDSPLDSHVSALAAHFAYGITLDIARRVARRIL